MSDRTIVGREPRVPDDELSGVGNLAFPTMDYYRLLLRKLYTSTQIAPIPNDPMSQICQ